MNREYSENKEHQNIDGELICRDICSCRRYPYFYIFLKTGKLPNYITNPDLIDYFMLYILKAYEIQNDYCIWNKYCDDNTYQLFFSIKSENVYEAHFSTKKSNTAIPLTLNNLPPWTEDLRLFFGTIGDYVLDDILSGKIHVETPRGNYNSKSARKINS